MPEHEYDNLDGAERELQAALRGLTPARSAKLDPIACAFQAGRSAGAREVRGWRIASAVAGVAIVILIFPVMRQSMPGVATEARSTLAVEIVRPDSVPVRREALSELSALRLRNIALQRGVDALPRSTEASFRPMRARDHSAM